MLNQRGLLIQAKSINSMNQFVSAQSTQRMLNHKGLMDTSWYSNFYGWQ
uniref:Uncharacterized protein n=1 Tax=Anguilla anguilla TaxID=7936 RepID=A0A0E9R464_ANGAN